MLRALCSTFAGVVLLGGCVTLSPAQEAYLRKVMATPLTVEMTKTEAVDAWGRAQSFLGQYSSMKIQTATDYVLQTYNPMGSGISYGYNVTKTPAGDRVRITVVCGTNNMFAGGDADRNAHILAHYIKSGDLSHPELIVR